MTSYDDRSFRAFVHHHPQAVMSNTRETVDSYKSDYQHAASVAALLTSGTSVPEHTTDDDTTFVPECRLPVTQVATMLSRYQSR